MVIDGRRGVSGERVRSRSVSVVDTVGGPEQSEGWAQANILSSGFLEWIDIGIVDAMYYSPLSNEGFSFCLQAIWRVR